MSEDKCGLIYCIHVPSMGSVITPHGQSLLYRQMYDEFLHAILGIKVNKPLPQVYFGNNDVHAGIVTEYGMVDVIRNKDDCLNFLVYKNIDIPRSAWRAGQLAYHAITGISKCYNPNRIDLSLKGGKCARDLVVVNVTATLGGQEKEATAGVIPLHYRNGKRISASEKEIGLLEQEVADELLLECPDKNPVVQYITTVAYAWHERHGILPGFHKGPAPKGLESRIIRSGVLDLKKNA
jgi:hypothetical protein